MPRVNKPNRPRPLTEGDWVLIQSTGDTGIVEKAMDDGERLWVRIPSSNIDWPWPRWVHVPSDKARRIRPPKPPKPEITTEEALM